MAKDKTEPERKAFKDWFDPEAAASLGRQIRRVYPRFDGRRFEKLACNGLANLEFADRIRQFASSLRTTLPESIPTSLGILTKSLPPVLPDCEEVTDGWLQWPLGQYIADHGVGHFAESFEAMIELTQRFSSEFAVRPFVETEPKRTFARLLKLTKHRNAHVRRWCSEGVRPRLPWGRKLHALVADPSPIFPILERLRDDPEEYVRRSVANNLNDIAKDHPDLVVEICKQWSRKSNAGRDWLIRRALRTLIKDGHSGALAIVGYGPPQRIQATLKIVPAKISIGASVQLVGELSTSCKKLQKLVVDYAVHYVRKSGTSAKVFKWTTTELPANGSVRLEKKHGMMVTTIRALYPGRHRVEMQVNGVRCAEASFILR